MRIRVNFALVHKTLLVVVKKLDGVLNRDHVLFAFAVNLVQHRGERRGFARTRRTRHENKSAWFIAQAFNNKRQAQRVKPLDFQWNSTEHSAYRASLIEYVS